METQLKNLLILWDRWSIAIVLDERNMGKNGEHSPILCSRPKPKLRDWHCSWLLGCSAKYILSICSLNPVSPWDQAVAEYDYVMQMMILFAKQNLKWKAGILP